MLSIIEFRLNIRNLGLIKKIKFHVYTIKSKIKSQPLINEILKKKKNIICIFFFFFVEIVSTYDICS